MADKRVDELDDIDALADADSFPVRDASATTELKEVTALQIGTYIAAQTKADAAQAAAEATAAAALSAHVAAADPHTGYLTEAAAAAGYQPLDADLTTIAAANNGSVLAATTASFTTADETKLDGIEAGAEVNDTASEILAKLVTVDGAGSGLDADLLDGQSSAAFAPAEFTILTESTTSRTLALTDAGDLIRCTNASATTVTVPPNSSVAFATGTVVTIRAVGAGGVTVAQGSGVTVNGNKSISQHESIVVVKVATDEWDAIGGTAA